MRLKTLVSIIIVTMALTLSGCGGGSSAPSNTVGGVASKGLIRNGVNNVKVYALNSDGSKGALLATTSTGANGEYSANVGGYGGAVLVEVSGTYTDEATGQPVTISSDRPLRAAYDSVAGSVTVSVTPLTELAVEKAGSTLTKDNIKTANAAVSALFNLDIIATKPVAPEAAALSGTSPAQRDYTLALAAISQMANSTTADAVFTVIAQIQANSDPSVTASQLTQALVDFTANSNNQTGVTSSTIPTEMLNVGSKTAVLNLSISGVNGNIYGVDLTLDLPPGVTVEADATGLFSASVLLTGSSAQNLVTAAKYTAATDTTPGTVHLGLVSGNGFSAGQFVAITCVVAPGVTPTFDNTLLESGAKVVDVNGADISGSTISLNAVF